MTDRRRKAPARAKARRPAVASRAPAPSGVVHQVEPGVVPGRPVVRVRFQDGSTHDVDALAWAQRERDQLGAVIRMHGADRRAASAKAGAAGGAKGGLTKKQTAQRWKQNIEARVRALIQRGHSNDAIGAQLANEACRSAGTVSRFAAEIRANTPDE